MTIITEVNNFGNSRGENFDFSTEWHGDEMIDFKLIIYVIFWKKVL